MSRREEKKARRSKTPLAEERKPRSSTGEKWSQQLFKWRVSENYIDMDDDEWGWGSVTINEFFEILKKSLQKYEDMTWYDVLNRTGCHPMRLDKIARRAKERLRAKFPDIDTLHQVDFSELGRVWGIKSGEYLQLVWHDAHHTVYPIRW